jgi:hypothetical protein
LTKKVTLAGPNSGLLSPERQNQKRGAEIVVNRLVCGCLASMLAYVVVCGSPGFGGHGHASHGSPPKAHHETPKPATPKPALKPAPHPAPKHESKPAPHESHKTAAANPKHEHDHDHHHRHDHHDHWDHEWVGGVVVGDGVAVDGGVAPVTIGDGVPAQAVVAGDVAPPVGSGRPQIQFSVDPSELDSYDAAARAAGMTRSEWIRSRLNAAVSQESK